MLNKESAALVVIDVQEKLFRVIHEKEKLCDNLQKLIKGAQALKLPIIVTEQYPQGLGPTISEIAGLLPDAKPLAKLAFSCYHDENFMKSLKALKREQVIIAGIEGHVCVYQTTVDLVKAGYEVYVVTDAVSSRTPENRKVGFKLMRHFGGVLTGTETVLFEMLKTAAAGEFKAISRIVK